MAIAVHLMYMFFAVPHAMIEGGVTCDDICGNAGGPEVTEGSPFEAQLVGGATA